MEINEDNHIRVTMVNVALNANPTLVYNDFYQHACLFHY